MNKERIEMLMKIPVDDQRLSFDGSIVDDSLTLKQQKIGHKSTLCLEPMQIHVQLVSHGGKQLSFPVEPDHTVAMIKDLISQQTTLKMDDKVCFCSSVAETPQLRAIAVLMIQFAPSKLFVSSMSY